MAESAETAWERALDRRRRERLEGLARITRSEEREDHEHSDPPEAADRG